nr:hypothetical protein [uncultured Caproiciproducens sp.]
MIAAESLNIGSVWLGMLRFFFEQKEEVNKLGISQGYEPFYGVAFGIKEKEQAAPKRNPDVVNYIRLLTFPKASDDLVIAAKRIFYYLSGEYILYKF